MEGFCQPGLDIEWRGEGGREGGGGGRGGWIVWGELRGVAEVGYGVVSDQEMDRQHRKGFRVFETARWWQESDAVEPDVDGRH